MDDNQAQTFLDYLRSEKGLSERQLLKTAVLEEIRLAGEAQNLFFSVDDLEEAIGKEPPESPRGAWAKPTYAPPEWRGDRAKPE